MQVVQYKQQSRMDEKRKRALDLHLNFIVGQTEQYSTWLSQGLHAVPNNNNNNNNNDTNKDNNDEDENNDESIKNNYNTTNDEGKTDIKKDEDVGELNSLERNDEKSNEEDAKINLVDNNEDNNSESTDKNINSPKNKVPVQPNGKNNRKIKRSNDDGSTASLIDVFIFNYFMLFCFSRFQNTNGIVFIEYLA